MANNFKNTLPTGFSYQPNAFVRLYANGGPGNPPYIASYSPTLPKNYATDYATRYKQFISNPIDPKTGAPYQGSGGQDASSTGTGGDYRPITPAERAERIKYLETFGPNDVQPGYLEEYLTLKNNDPYFVASFDPSKTMYAPYDLRKYTAPTAAQLAQLYPPAPPAPESVGYIMSANTGKVMPERSNVDNAGNKFIEDRQYSQYLEEFANDPAVLAKKQAEEIEKVKNLNLIKQLSQEQLKEMKGMNITPMQYVEMKGLKLVPFQPLQSVEFAMGGNLDNINTEEGPNPLEEYAVTYGDLPPEAQYYLKIPGVNANKVVEWFNLGINEPQTFNQAILLAEAVGYNPEQAKVVAAQWQMESSGGARLSSPYNYFGIKSHNEAVRNKLAERGINVSAGKEANTTEVADGKKVSKNASFMEFNNAFEGFAAHKAFLETNSRYAKALTAGTAKEFAIGLEKAGYATAPNYGTTLYQDYIVPKEKNPKSGDVRPKSFGETKSEKIKPFVAPQVEINKIPVLAPTMINPEPEISVEPTFSSGMYGSVPFEQKIEETKAIPVNAPAGFFGSGKTMFKQGGSMNFKSPNAYQKWLGYVHATGLAESTPGHQKVSIGGKPHKVEHQYGGHMYAAGGSFNNPGFNALPVSVQNKIKANSFAEGGSMGNQLTQFDGGFKHDDPNPQNVFSGIPQGIAPDNQMNIVEKGETKFDSKNYIFSDNLKVSKEIAADFNLPKGLINKTYSEASKILNLNKSRRENDTIENNYKEKMLSSLMQAQEIFKEAEMQKDFAAMMEKYPEQMAAMMQAQAMQEQTQTSPQEQMMMPEQIPGEVVAAGSNPAQEMPSPEPVPSSQLPMSYGGSLYGCGGKMYMSGGNMYDFGGWMDDNAGAVSGAGTGALSGAAAGAQLGSIVPGLGTAIGAGVGALVGGIAGGVSGNKKDKQEQAAEDLAQQEQLAQGNQMQQMQNPAYVTPTTQYALNAGAGTGATYGYMARQGGVLYENGGPTDEGEKRKDEYFAPMAGGNKNIKNLVDPNAFFGSLPLTSLIMDFTLQGKRAAKGITGSKNYVSEWQDVDAIEDTKSKPGPYKNIKSDFTPGTIYTYQDRPGTFYKYTPNGKMLVKNEGTNWQYQEMDDPNNKRFNALQKGFDSGKTKVYKEAKFKAGGPMYHQYSQLNPMWKNNAGPMGQGLANTQVYAMGGHMYDGGGFTSEQPSMYLPGQPDLPTFVYGPINQPSNKSAENYNVNTNLTDTTQDLSVTGTPMGMLTNLAPIAYNVYQGLSKPRTYTPNDFYVQQEAIRPDYTQAENEARYSYAQLMDSLKSAGISGGNYITNAQQAANIRNKGMAEVAMAEENAYLQDLARVRGANALAETEARKAALQTNWALRTAQQEHLKEALGQAKGITDANLANELAYNYAIMGAPDISKFKKIGYTPYLESLFNRQKRG